MSKVKNTTGKQKNSNIFVIIILVLVLVFVGYKFIAPKESAEQSTQQASQQTSNLKEGVIVGKDLKIAKADITDKAVFYPYKEAGTYMEVVAVKASDGTIRTALNTCQVCYDSGKGYYKQEGNTLVCQNCGNVFGVDDVEIVKGGCNPVPILKENKTDDGQFITISGEFLASNKDYFARWKK